MKYILCLVGLLALSGISNAQHFSGKQKVQAGVAGKNDTYTSEYVYGGLSFTHKSGSVYFKTTTLNDPQGASFDDIKPEANRLIEIKYRLPEGFNLESLSAAPKKLMVISDVQVGAKTKKMELPLTLTKNSDGTLQMALNFTDKLSNLNIDKSRKSDATVYFNFSGILTSTN